MLREKQLQVIKTLCKEPGEGLSYNSLVQNSGLPPLEAGAVIRNLQYAGFITQVDDDHPLLHPTNAGKAFLQNGNGMLLVENRGLGWAFTNLVKSVSPTRRTVQPSPLLSAVVLFVLVAVLIFLGLTVRHRL